MKISLHSDLHNEFQDDAIIPKVPEADILIFAGDVTTGKNAPDYYRQVAAANPDTTILYILGNHEFYESSIEEVITINREAHRQNDQIHFLENNAVEIDGVEFIGATLWSDFALAENANQIAQIENVIADFFKIQYGDQKQLIRAETGMKALYQNSHRFIQQRLQESNAGKKVVISHFSPHPELGHVDFVGSPLTPYFISDSRDLFSLAPDLWCYGHTHCNAYAGQIIEEVWVETNQGGYPTENTGYCADKLIEL